MSAALSIEPAVLRHSEELRKLLMQAAQKKEEDDKAPVTQLEDKAREVKNRLDLYERVRSGGEIEMGQPRPRVSGEYGIVVLDRHGPTWFSLKSLRFYANPNVGIITHKSGYVRSTRRCDFEILEAGNGCKP